MSDKSIFLQAWDEIIEDSLTTVDQRKEDGGGTYSCSRNTVSVHHVIKQKC
jgi:hypothetical protein